MRCKNFVYLIAAGIYALKTEIMFAGHVTLHRARKHFVGFAFIK